MKDEAFDHFDFPPESRIAIVLRTVWLAVTGGAFVVLGLAVVSEGLAASQAQPAAPTPSTVGLSAPAAPLNAPPSGPHLAPNTLQGPGGPVTLPLGEPALVNVWLQACPDCMPAFDAHRALGSGWHGDAPVVNIAFGSARLEWARQYGVDEQLVLDPGHLVVKPLGISTFTTLVVDAQGAVTLRIKPTDPDYAKRVRSALQDLQLSASPLPVEKE